MRFCLGAIVVCCAASAGCGTTKWSDTSRTATEQLLISDSMDRAVSRLDFRAVAGKKVYLDSSPLSGVTDSAYLVSLLRQHMLAEGCLMMDKREEADYVVEVRAGAVGTDRREVLFGVPASEIGSVVPVPGLPTRIPEMPLAKKTEQRAVTKIAVFAYNRHTGRPLWQSGAAPVESKAKDLWVLGAGPFQRGTIYEGTKFAGDKITIPLITPGNKDPQKLGDVSVANQAYFAEPEEQLANADPKPERGPSASPQAPVVGQKVPSDPNAGVIHAGHTAPRIAPEPETPPQPIGGAAVPAPITGRAAPLQPPPATLTAPSPSSLLGQPETARPPHGPLDHGPSR